MTGTTALPPADSRLARRLREGRFALTAEVTPPLSGGADALLKKARFLKDHVDAVNVTDGASARVTMASLPAAALLVQDGIEPVFQVTCRDRNRIALQGDLLGAHALGIRNLLVLNGDDPKAGDQPDAKPVFDIGSTDVIAIAAGMRDKGVVPSGRKIESPPNFFIAAADTPVDPPVDWQPGGLTAKADAGAQFVQTQLCFDIDIIRRYIARLADFGLTERLSILIGMGPLASARSARWMRENLWGVIIPDTVVDRMEAAEAPKEEGAKICAELLQQLADIPGVAGAHLMAPLNEDSVPHAIELANLPDR